MILDTKYKSLEVKLSSSVNTNELPIVVSYTDIAAFGSRANDTVTNGSTAVTIVSAPLTDRPIARIIESISILNKDVVSATVIVQLNNNSTLRELVKFILSPGDILFYERGKGWYLIDKYGNTKIISIVINQGDMIYLIASGTDTYTASSASISAYIEGQSFAVKFPNANTGAATLNINGLGAKSLKNFGNAALVANDIKAGQILDVTYDGTNFQIKSVTDNIVNAV